MRKIHSDYTGIREFRFRNTKRDSADQHKQQKSGKEMPKNKIKINLSGQIQLNSQFEQFEYSDPLLPSKNYAILSCFIHFLFDVEPMNNNLPGTNGFSTAFDINII